MEYNLVNLIKSASDFPELKKSIASIILKYSTDINAQVLSAEVLQQSIPIDVHQLESMINPDKFEFQEVGLGEVTVENVQ
tara:strand:+ start:343 stop:582 length:240 start_codon:yes stop_codon:yes gene_type:complete